MAEFKTFRATTAKGEVDIELDEKAMEDLGVALSTLGVRGPRRRAILEGEVPIPGMLYPRFKKDMERRYPETFREVRGERVRVRRGKAARAGAKKLTVEQQVKAERARKRREGSGYTAFIPATPSPALGSRRAEPTSNIVVSGTHRGTKYIIEEIAPNMWQARVIKHPWTKLRQTAAERMAARRWLVGDLMKKQFPTFTGERGWAGAQQNVEGEIDRSYEIFVETGNIPPELERHVKEEIASVRRGGRTPSLAPTRRPSRAVGPRVRKKRNPGNPKLPHTGTLPKAAMPMFKKTFEGAYEYYRTERKATKKEAEEIAARTAWDEIERYYYKRGDKWVKRKKVLPQVERPHDVRLKTKPKRKTKKKKVSRKKTNPKNPTAAVHQELGEGFLAESEKLWEAYCKKPNHKKLLDAYRVLILAEQEFEYTGDAKGKKQARAGLRAAKAEILSCMKKK